VSSPKIPTYVCVRHGKARADTHTTGLFLCNDCKRLFVKSAFRGGEPDFEYGAIRGYCSHCGRRRSVRARYWYLCDVCERVVRSFAGERVARDYVLLWWDELRRTDKIARSIKLKITDPPKVKQYSLNSESEETRKPSPDFVGIRKGKRIFGIEMKSGKGSPRKMSEFQLDVSDCKDIMGWVKPLRIPAFLFHIQARDEYDPPTSRKIATDGWYMDVYEMQKSFKTIRQRPRENRPAAYYDKKAFHPLENFLGEGFMRDLGKMKAKLKKRLPVLYKYQSKPSSQKKNRIGKKSKKTGSLRSSKVRGTSRH